MSTPSACQNRRVTLALALLLVLANWPAHALAQASDASKPADGDTPASAPKASDKSQDDKAATTVTVTGRKSRIDRQSYDVTQYPDSQTGTAADTLNKVPGLIVDPNGNVTYRGKTPTIYLNGHPSLMLSGDNRGLALQSMPASYLSSVEVISNPGAQFGSTSDNAIINIVTKRNLPAGLFGTAQLQAGSDGGYLATSFFTYHLGKLSLTGSLVDSDVDRPVDSQSDLTQRGATGLPTTTTVSKSRSKSISEGPSLNTSLEYDLTPDDVLTGELGYRSGRFRSDGPGHTLVEDANGEATQISDSFGGGSGTNKTGDSSLTWTHYGKKPDEKFKISGTYSRSSSDSLFSGTNTYALSTIAANLTQAQVSQSENGSDTRKTQVKVDYDTPVGDDQLSTGVEFDQLDNHTHSHFMLISGGSAATNGGLFDTNFFSHQTQTGAYITYQKELGTGLTVLGGLRAETFTLGADSISSNTTAKISFTRLNPSLFATYVLSPKAKLHFSYSHRLQLPQASDLNPAAVYNGTNSVSIGNPHLKPQETQSFEANYDYSGKIATWGLHGFYQQTHHTVTTSSIFIPDPLNDGNLVLQTSRGNFGQGDTSGLEATWSHHGKTLNLSLDGTVSAMNLHTPDVGSLSIISVSARASFNYTLPNKDIVYGSYTQGGRTLTADGYATGFSFMSLSYRHTLTSKLGLTLTLNNPQGRTKIENVSDTHTYRRRFDNSFQGTTFYAGISYRFGGDSKSKKP